MLPLVGIVPLQPPEASQVLACAASHCRVTDAPITTLFSLAFNVTDGGGTTAATPVPLYDCASEPPSPHADNALRAANPRIDFNANADLERRLRRIELIMRLPRNCAGERSAPLDGLRHNL